ncbi:MAG: TlyA family RNA methyltransferase [Xanthobacteraceae bacterium]|nr:TlyA family RNA methyltransferase [Xanthobacteraceae bacterium]MBV9627652.1 TlyA family RNA methyltransferase [Xanthobacteraceae bacterium]
MPSRRRADLLLVERGLFESRARAQAAIAAGLVTADDVVVAKPSAEIAVDAVLHATAPHPWVSRGGVKLADALDRAGISVHGRVALDVGASTGGFSEVLLTRGARLVYAVDVGHGQLHPRLRGRADLVLFEHTDIRSLDPAQLTEQPDLIVIDVSFISLKLVLPAALKLAAPRAQVVALIKPQFEASPRNIKKGIVRDPAVHAAVCDDIVTVVRQLGCTVSATFPSAIAGGDGNREFFILAQRD